MNKVEFWISLIYLQRQGVHVCSKSDNRGRTRANLRNNAGFGKWVGVRDAKPFEFSADESAGVVFFETELWVFMDFPSYRDQPIFVLLGGALKLFSVIRVLRALDWRKGSERQERNKKKSLEDQEGIHLGLQFHGRLWLQLPGKLIFVTGGKCRYLCTCHSSTLAR